MSFFNRFAATAHWGLLPARYVLAGEYGWAQKTTDTFSDTSLHKQWASKNSLAT
jgi:hypothetical protein